MDVMIDGESGFTFHEEPADALAAVAQIEGALQRKGRALMGVAVDGRDVTPEQLRLTLENTPVSAVKTLEIRSAELAALIAETLSELESTVPDLPQACHELAAVFQGTEPEQGYEPFQRLAELWGQIKAREKRVVSALQGRVDDIRVGDKTIVGLHEDLNEVLSEAANALESGDLILLGDLLEYELAPRAELEAQIVAQLKERSQQRAC